MPYFLKELVFLIFHLVSIYWYMCTQSENIALQYALLDDLDEYCQAVVQQVGVCLVFA